MHDPQAPHPTGDSGSQDAALHTTEQLVAAMQHGDPRVGRALYARYADRLFDLALSCTHDHDQAALIVGDVIVETSQVCLSVRTMSLTTWMYERLREHLQNGIGSRIAPDDRVIDLPTILDITDPVERGTLMWTALAGASERDQLMANLALRHHTSSIDMAKIMGISEASSSLLWETTAATLRTQLGALLALGWLQSHLNEPAGVLEPLMDLALTWDGNYTPLVHREAANRLGDHPEIIRWVHEHLDDPLQALAGVPLHTAPATLQPVVNERLAMAWQLRSGANLTQVEPAAEPEPSHESDDDDDCTIPPGAWPEEVVPTSEPQNGSRARQQGGAPRFPRPLVLALIALSGIVVGSIGTVTVQRWSTPTPIGMNEVAAPGASKVATIGATAAQATVQTADPGRLTVPTGVLPIESGTSTSMLLANTGGTVLNWHVEHLPDWVEANPSSGTLAPGTTAEVALSLSKVSDSAEQNGRIDIHWEGIESGFATVDVQAKAGQPPQVGEVVISQSPPLCDQPLDLTIDVVDNAGVKSVVVVGHTDTGTTYTQSLVQTDQTNTWRGAIGPIVEPGKVRLSVTATDTQNNTIEANRGSVTITPCTPS